MKKVISITVLLVLCLAMVLLSGCDDPNAVYDDDATIAQSSDSRSASMSSRSTTSNEYKQKVKITGTQTVWRYSARKDENITLSYLLSVSEGGKAKLVLITPDDEVITLIENVDNTVYTEMTTQTISVKKGINRIKIVGYEDPKIELKLRVKVGQFVTD